MNRLLIITSMLTLLVTSNTQASADAAKDYIIQQQKVLKPLLGKKSSATKDKALILHDGLTKLHLLVTIDPAFDLLVSPIDSSDFTTASKTGIQSLTPLTIRRTDTMQDVMQTLFTNTCTMTMAIMKTVTKSSDNDIRIFKTAAQKVNDALGLKLPQGLS